MSFFITSVNPGKGGNLGGLAGADAYCTALAESVGIGGKTWRAYLSTTQENSLSEQGRAINGRGDEHNRHDVMTGSNAKGTLEGNACNDWTSQTEGSAMVGHHDRIGGGAAPTSWNSAHPSRRCSTADLRATGGDVLFHCFAAK